MAAQVQARVEERAGEVAGERKRRLVCGGQVAKGRLERLVMRVLAERRREMLQVRMEVVKVQTPSRVMTEAAVALRMRAVAEVMILRWTGSPSS